MKKSKLLVSLLCIMTLSGCKGISSSSTSSTTSDSSTTKIDYLYVERGKINSKVTDKILSYSDNLALGKWTYHSSLYNTLTANFMNMNIETTDSFQDNDVYIGSSTISNLSATSTLEGDTTLKSTDTVTAEGYEKDGILNYYYDNTSYSYAYPYFDSFNIDTTHSVSYLKKAAGFVLTYVGTILSDPEAFITNNLKTYIVGCTIETEQILTTTYEDGSMDASFSFSVIPADTENYYTPLSESYTASLDIDGSIKSIKTESYRYSDKEFLEPYYHTTQTYEVSSDFLGDYTDSLHDSTSTSNTLFGRTKTTVDTTKVKDGDIAFDEAKKICSGIEEHSYNATHFNYTSVLDSNDKTGLHYSVTNSGQVYKDDIYYETGATTVNVDKVTDSSVYTDKDYTQSYTLKGTIDKLAHKKTYTTGECDIAIYSFDDSATDGFMYANEIIQPVSDTVKSYSGFEPDGPYFSYSVRKLTSDDLISATSKGGLINIKFKCFYSGNVTGEYNTFEVTIKDNVLQKAIYTKKDDFFTYGTSANSSGENAYSFHTTISTYNYSVGELTTYQG